mgnify:CR=1 FL=1
MKETISMQRYDISEMIKATGFLIEANMNLYVSPSKNIDFSIIDELKRKRIL